MDEPVRPQMAGSHVRGPSTGWREDADRAMRTLAAVTVAAVLLAVLIGGIGGRLAMRLLAAVNPDTEGSITDDGFTVGQFTIVNTLQLMGATAQMGLIAAMCYLLARHLAVGPRWFRVVSMGVGAGVVVAALIVTPDGVDFTAFDPPLLPIALFIAIPVLYVAALVMLAERFLADDSWFSVGDIRLVAATAFVGWAVGGPLLVILAVVVAVWSAWRLLIRISVGSWLRSPTTKWVLRASLAVVFAVAVSNLISDIQSVT